METTSTNNAPITVGLLWHSANSDNLGVGALTVSNIAIVENIADQLGRTVKFKILGWRDPEPAYVKGDNIEVVSLRARDFLDPSGLYSAIRGCDLVLDISAGDSFADIYGAKRFMFNILAKANVVAARRTFILSPQTVGPFQRWWARILAGIFMRRATKVVTRDSLSTSFLKDFGLDNKIVEATDVAMRLPYTPPKKKTGSKTAIGLNVSGLLFNGGYTQDNMFSLVADYPALIRKLITHFQSLPDCEIHLVGHVISHGQAVEDDYRVAELLVEEFPGAILAPRFANPSDAKSYIAGMDFFAGARMHACIAAFSSGVPVLPMAYSRKFAGLFGTLEYKHLADCKTQTAEEIIDIIITAFERRAELKKEVDISFAIAEKKLGAYEEVLRVALAKQG